MEKIDKSAQVIIGGSLYCLFLLEQLFSIQFVTYGFAFIGLFLCFKDSPKLTFLLIAISIIDPFKLGIVALIFRALALVYILSILPLRFTLLMTVAVVLAMLPFESLKANLNVFKGSTSIREYAENGYYSSIFKENISLAYLSLLGLKVRHKLLKLVFLLLVIISGSQTVLAFYLLGILFEFKSKRFLFSTILASVGIYIFYMFIYSSSDNSFLSSRGGMFISLMQVVAQSDIQNMVLGWTVTNDEFFQVLKNYSDLPPILIDDKNTNALGDVYWLYVLVRGGLLFFISFLLLSMKVFGHSMRFFMLGFFNQFLMDRGFQVFSAYGRNNRK